MGALALAATQLRVIFQNLMPRGDVWPRDEDAVQTQVVGALVPTYERLLARDNNLLVDAFPATTNELLPEWEATLGLPDPCLGPNPTLAARQASVVARFAMKGGQSIAYYEKIALNLGGAITIQEFAPARFGVNSFGDSFRTIGWAFYWQVTLTVGVLHRAQFGDPFGEPFWDLENNTVMCELLRTAPAHTVPIFVLAAGVPADLFTPGSSLVAGPDPLG